jgi:iron complex transport system substrate-binding protein
MLAMCLTSCNTQRPSAPVPRPRIISHSPAITEMLVYLGYQDHLVGVTNWCELPDGMDLPRVGDANGIRTEAALALEPDLILTQSDPAQFMDLRKRLAGLTIKQLTIESLDDIKQTMLTLAKDIEGIEPERVLQGKGSGTASEAIARYIVDLDSYSRNNIAGGRPETMFILGYRNPSVAGPGTYIGDLIEHVGGQNTGQKIPGSQRWRKAKVESIIRAQPEVLIVHTARDNAERALEFWTSGNLPIMLPAARKGNVFVVTDETWLHPSPNILKVVPQLRKMVDQTWGEPE